MFYIGVKLVAFFSILTHVYTLLQSKSKLQFRMCKPLSLIVCLDRAHVRIFGFLCVL